MNLILLILGAAAGVGLLLAAVLLDLGEWSWRLSQAANAAQLLSLVGVGIAVFDLRRVVNELSRKPDLHVELLDDLGQPLREVSGLHEVTATESDGKWQFQMAVVTSNRGPGAARDVEWRFRVDQSATIDAINWKTERAKVRGEIVVRDVRPWLYADMTDPHAMRVSVPMPPVGETSIDVDVRVSIYMREVPPVERCLTIRAVLASGLGNG